MNENMLRLLGEASLFMGWGAANYRGEELQTRREGRAMNFRSFPKRWQNMLDEKL